MQTFKGFVLSTFLLLLGIVSLGEASAQGFGQGRGPNGYGQQRGDKFEVEEVLSRYVNGTTTLALRNILDLDQSALGQKLIKLELFATSSSSFATAQVEINGRSIGFAQNVGWRYDQSVVFDIPQGDRVIGRDIQTLKMKLQGSMYIDRIVATLKDDGQGQGGGQGGGRSEWVTSFERQRFFNKIPLKQELKLGRQHIGKEVKTVIIKANPVGQRVTAMSLVVDGKIVAGPEYLDRNNGEVQFKFNQRNAIEIDQGDAIKVVFDGEILVHEMAVELLEKQQRNRDIRVSVNQRVSGERVFLDQLLRLDYQTMSKKFEKIVIKGKLAGRNSSLRACARGFTNGAACDSVSVQSGDFELVLNKFEMQAADIFLMARGEALITEVILVEDQRGQNQYPW
ncbi:MAG: hypothetical protein COW01_11560 [Bdellovibrionales bacterium CG12_big_fil_rev_8_21_14_0_65_38_15]|nr:MAG: hypothetical protein COW79_11590 [Bdellovibrionales bacterium CG22_combo_CG10-13_8_21_14_all_38_13]PIQ54248.1 MAG: hypothetical protein COW01_11560 [Bdellovibrionales bacterium CG12_big_fil_rev_8_21_14_0_65_38_15]PIR29304.1 MAG: hypothetical protein COV38_11205 [Bdellovibrionales bacterium CG11_big_fil_rev_8_21_14_0_20_38_13]